MKQTLCALDIPPLIPANSFNDFSHAIESYRPGTHNPNEIPAIPIYSKSGRIRPYGHELSKRIASMPVFPNSFFQKQLPLPPMSTLPPSPPPKSPTNRVSSMYTPMTPNTPPTPYFNSPTKRPNPELILRKISDEPYNPTNPYTTRHLIIDEDDDSLFSDLTNTNTTASTVDRSVYSVIDINALYNAESSPSASSHSDISSASSVYSDISSTPHFSPDVPVISDDLSSYMDSLFSDEPEPKPKPTQKPTYTPIDVAGVTLQTIKDLPPPPAITISKRKDKIKRHRETQRHSMSLGAFSVDSKQSLGEAKTDLQTFVRQRPFSYSLDTEKDYKDSRFKVKALNPRAVSSGNVLKSKPQPPSKDRHISFGNPQAEHIQPKLRAVTELPQPRQVSEPSSVHQNKRESVRSHIQSFFHTLTRKEEEEATNWRSKNQKDLPQVPEDGRQNRFDRRAYYRSYS